MNLKQQLYFACGAQEFWLCDASGRLSFFDQQGELTVSRLAPGFPRSIETAQP